MAYNNFDKIEYESQNYYPRDTRAKMVVSTHSGTTNTWTGPLPEGVDNYESPEYLIIDYFLQNNTNGNPVKLGLGGLTALPVYKSQGTDQVTNEFSAKSMIRLAYVKDNALNSGNGAWKVIGSDASGGGGGGTVHTQKENVSVVSSWSAGSASTLQTEEVTVHGFKDYAAGSMTTASVTKGELTITIGQSPTFDDDEKTFTAIKSNTWVQGSAPSLTVANFDVVTGVTQD